MRYLLLIYKNEDFDRTPEQSAAIAAEVYTLMDEMKRRGILLGVDRLEPVATATTLRKRDGKTVITDGPFAETKEQLGGYFMLDCKDLDEALEWAARLPLCNSEGCIEVRPIASLPQRQPEDASASVKA